MEATDIRIKEEAGLRPRLAPIEKPHGFMLKLAYWYSKRKIGKVITPMKVIQTRFPESLKLSRNLINISEKIDLSREFSFLIKSFVATLNGCAFCVDIAKAEAHQRKTKTQKYNDLLHYDESPVFSEAEKAALAYAEEITMTKQTSDAVFARLKHYFTEREIVEITWLIASEHFYNLMNRPLNIGSDELCELLAEQTR